MTQRTINAPEKPVLDRLRERWAQDVARRSAEQEQSTAFYVPGMDLLDAIAALTQQDRRIKQLEAELHAMHAVEPHGEPQAYVVTQDVRLVRHGSEYGPAGKWDVLLTRNFDTYFERVRTFWPVSFRPLEHGMWAWSAVIDDFGNLVPVDDLDLED